MRISLPLIQLVRQNIPAPCIDDLTLALKDSLELLKQKGSPVKPGQTVALAVGSRGIGDLTSVIKYTVDWFKSLGAKPFIAPAMGSHGGATDHGQKQVLTELKITEETMGAPVVSHVETVEVGKTSFGKPVFVGRDFVQADHVFLINRVKPHTSFRGQVESGLIKMATIGMGKKDGATVAHQLFFAHGFEPVVLESFELISKAISLLGGLALVENRFEKLAFLEFVLPQDFLKTEKKLLQKSKELMGKIPFNDVDLLIIDEMGKNISGSGMDSNVTGRIFNQVTNEPSIRQFKRIYVRDLTHESDGNALGIGVADFASVRILKRMDTEKTRINCVTANVPEKGRIPMIYDTDKKAITDALATVGLSDVGKARIVWVKNTLQLEYMWITEYMKKDLGIMEQVSSVSSFKEMPFDHKDDLPFETFPYD